MSVDFLVGCTGFIGSNLAHQHNFSGYFCSSNVHDAFRQSPDILVYAGVPSEMFTANKYSDKDREIIATAEENISRIAPKKLVLISTVAVYDDTSCVDEDTQINSSCLLPYGANRLALEKWSAYNFYNCLIIRLPALFGRNLRKNFIYDFVHVVPSMLTPEKLTELSEHVPELRDYYSLSNNGLMKCRQLTLTEAGNLKSIFCSLGFTALNFTDSRSVYQFYPLANLWHDIETALLHGLKLVNLATPPISAGKIYNFLTGEEFVNELSRQPFSYDIRTKHYKLFGGTEGYIMSLEQELSAIKNFVKEC